RTVIDEEQHPRHREALNEEVKRGLGLRVDPVEIFEDHAQWLTLALAGEELLQGRPRPGLLEKRPQRPERIVRRQRVEQREDGRDAVTKLLVECEHPADHALPDTLGVFSCLDDEVRLQY